MTTTFSEIIRQWPSYEAKQWVQTFIPKVCTNFQVLAVVAFGSAVRGIDYCADIDLLVIYDPPKPDVPGRPIDVDIRWHERTEAERLIAEGHELLGWVVRYGELICEQDDYWTELRHAWLDKIPFPSADVADQRAERAQRLYSELVDMGDLDSAHEQYLAALTQRARATLIRKGVYPASRPELPAQLRQIEEYDLAAKLEETLQQREQP